MYGLKSALDEALRSETEDMTIAPVNQRMQNIIHRVQLSRGKGGMGDGKGGSRGSGGGSEAYVSGSSAAVVAAANASAGYREIMEAVMQVSEKGGQAAASASGAGGAALHAATTAGILVGVLCQGLSFLSSLHTQANLEAFPFYQTLKQFCSRVCYE